MFRLPASNHVTTPRDSRRPLLGVFLTACLLAAPGLSQTAPTHEPPKAAEDLLTGRRFLTFNTVVRVNQIEVTRDQSKGEDESIVHTPAEARLFRETIEEAWPGGRITWAFSWRALHDERETYRGLRELVVSYHRRFGDEITFIPGAYFANMYNSR